MKEQEALDMTLDEIRERIKMCAYAEREFWEAELERQLKSAADLERAVTYGEGNRYGQ